MSVSRRQLLRWSLGGAGALLARSLASGLPVSFLRDPSRVRAQAGTKPTFLVMAFGTAGDPLNTNCPGTYPAPGDKNDHRAAVEHATASELAGADLGTVNGQPITGADFEDPAMLRLGETTTWAARPWALLPQPLLDRMRFFHHATYANAHGENVAVRRFRGAVKGPTGTGSESLPGFFAQELTDALGTTVGTPLSVGGPSLFYEGRELRQLSPTTLQSLFSEAPDMFGVSASQFAALRDSTLDAAYKAARERGTHAQREFIDSLARSRQDALQLSSELGELLTAITGDGVADQVLAVSALIRRNVAPVIGMALPFGGDNHQDADLLDETQGNVAGIEGIRLLWEELTRHDLQDRVTFAYLNVFGRKMNRSGGRGHNAEHHVMVMFGPDVKPGVVGGLSPDDINRAADIDGVPFEETLAAAGKTLAKAVGVPQAVYERRIVGGRAID